MIRVNATRYARVACSIPLIRRGAKRFKHLAKIVEKHDRRAEKAKGPIAGSDRPPRVSS